MRGEKNIGQEKKKIQTVNKMELNFVELKQNQLLYKKVKPQLEKFFGKEYKAKEILSKLKDFSKQTFVKRSYESFKEKIPFNFSVLYSHYDSQLQQIYSEISKFVLQYQISPTKIKLILSNKSQQYIILKIHLLYILCLMSLNLVPKQPYEENTILEERFHHIKNFALLFSEIEFKTVGIIEYLKKQLKNIKKIEENNEAVLITRSVLGDERKFFDSFAIKNFGTTKISEYKIQPDGKSIQQFYEDHFKVDFANKYIGGGSLAFGALQQQIMFATRPQLYVSMLLCEKMENQESLIFSGFKKYSKTKGYSHQTKYIGPNDYNYKYQPYEREKKKYMIAKEHIIAIDALDFNQIDQNQQSKQCIIRQLMKAYVGFKNCPQNSSIVTGNWGCGYFGGDIKLKFVIQLLAASMAGKKIKYCPFDKNQLYQNFNVLQKFPQPNIKNVLQQLINNPSQFILSKKSTISNIFKPITKLFRHK